VSHRRVSCSASIPAKAPCPRVYRLPVSSIDSMDTRVFPLDPPSDTLITAVNPPRLPLTSSSYWIRNWMNDFMHPTLQDKWVQGIKLYQFHDLNTYSIYIDRFIHRSPYSESSLPQVWHLASSSQRMRTSLASTFLVLRSKKSESGVRL